MDFSYLLVGGAAAGLIASCWGYIKTFLWKMCNFLVQRIEIRENSTSQAIIAYLIDNYKRAGLYDRAYCGTTEYFRQTGQTGLVGFEHFGQDSMIFWNGWIPFVFNGAKKSQNTTNGGSPYSSQSQTIENHGSILFLRGTMDVEKMVEKAIASYNKVSWDTEQNIKSNARRFFIRHIPDIGKNKELPNSYQTLAWYRRSHVKLLGYSADDLGRGKTENESMLDNLIFPNDIKNLIGEIRLWRKHRDWYVKKCIPWKRGWLLYGPPGTGKTALARAFAEDLDLPIFVFNLAETSNIFFKKEWSEMQASTPCIALIEDIDNVFHGRENVANTRRAIYGPLLPKSNKNGDKDSEEDERSVGILNFDVFLNCLDGVDKAEGIFTIITTNDITKIDPALGQPRKSSDGTLEFIGTRPGRIDKAIELSYMRRSEKLLLAKRILGDYPDDLQTMIDYVNGFPKNQETPAQFQERCAQIALQRLWEMENSYIKDLTMGIVVEKSDSPAVLESLPK